MIAWSVAASLAGPSAALARAPAAPDEASTDDPEIAEAQALYDEGKAQFDTTHYDDAIRLWTKAYGILSDTPEHAPIKAAIIYNLATAQERAFEIDEDITHLRRAVALMDRYAASIPELYGDGPEAAEETERIAGRLRDVRARIEQAEAEQRPDEPPPAVDPSPKQSDAPPPDPKARAFVISGATLLAVGVVGIGVMAGGLALGRASNDISDLDPDDLEGRGERFDRGRGGNVMAYVGGALGGAALITGAVLLGLGLERRQAARTAAAPMLAPGLAGVSMRGSF
jgi:tetratricopeptide (TPR) repeat protein